jgi:hypothetical protein
MSENAIFIGWGNAVRTREQQASTVFGEANDYWHKLQDAGDIEEYEFFMLEPHGGDLAGFAVLKGEASSLATIHASEEFQNLTTKANLVVEDFGVVGAMMNGAAEAQVDMYTSMAAGMN